MVLWRKVHGRTFLTGSGAGSGPKGWFGPGLGNTYSWFLLHSCLFHAERDLGVLIAEQYVCYTR